MCCIFSLPTHCRIVTVTYFAARVCQEGLTGSDFMEEWYTHVLHEEGGTTNDAFVNVGVPTSNDDIYIMQRTKEEKECEATASETTETHESVAENTNNRVRRCIIQNPSNGTQWVI